MALRNFRRADQPRRVLTAMELAMQKEHGNWFTTGEIAIRLGMKRSSYLREILCEMVAAGQLDGDFSTFKKGINVMVGKFALPLNHQRLVYNTMREIPLKTRGVTQEQMRMF